MVFIELQGLGMKIKSDLTFMAILGHAVVWVVLICITLGIALFFYPYYFAQFVLNNTYLIDENGVERKFKCEMDIFANVGHVISWFVISVVTLGIGYIFYCYKVWGFCLNKTTVYVNA